MGTCRLALHIFHIAWSDFEPTYTPPHRHLTPSKGERAGSVGTVLVSELDNLVINPSKDGPSHGADRKSIGESDQTA